MLAVASDDQPRILLLDRPRRPHELHQQSATDMQRLGAIAKVKAQPHRFRDTFAVELLTNGVDIRSVQLLLGHKSVRTTEKHYADFVAAHQALLDSAVSTMNFQAKTAGSLLMKPRQN